MYIPFIKSFIFKHLVKFLQQKSLINRLPVTNDQEFQRYSSATLILAHSFSTVAEYFGILKNKAGFMEWTHIGVQGQDLNKI